MKIAVIKSLGGKKFETFLKSLKSTIPNKGYALHFFQEKKTRGHTLNYILKKLKFDEHILILVDDLIFRKGWFEALTKNINKADILGMSMLYPDSKIIQDNGYDLIKLNNQSFLQPLKRGKNFSKDLTTIKYTDCICGCFMFINKKVFQYQKKFYPGLGANRWDEFSFILKAKERGFKLATVNHYLHHHGTSTKNNPNNKFSSISYQIEKKLWKKFEKKFISLKKIRKKVSIVLDSKIHNFLSKKKRVLFYGAGILSEKISSLKKTCNKKVIFASSMPEEIGGEINNSHIISDIKKINYNNIDTVIITPNGVSKTIYKLFFATWIKDNWKGKIYKVKELKYNQKWIYRLDEIKK